MTKFMRFGAHVSAAGGLWKAGKAGKELGCEVIQIFSRSPQTFAAKPITDEDAEKFKVSMKENDIHDVYIHAPYIINLASAKNTTRFGSVKILREELERGTQLGAKAIMFHPGSAKEVGREEGINMIVKGLDRIMDGYDGTCQLLIEISAGAGEVMGDQFEEIAAFLNKTERGKEIGVCFDTQHAFASGYDLRTKEAVDATFKAFDDTVGLKKLVASHCNDSKVEFEAHKDRHQHLGHGFIGVDAFKYIVEHPKLQHIDLILETPFTGEEEKGSREEDIALLKKYRG
ncbi:deoxyribonuclease IV [bacterium]|nr:deoxyribonuclease IV [bacterium]NBX49247.1 deoxyribonuclease IV [bacterium]